MQKILNSKLFKLLFIVCCLAIFTVSLMPGKQLPSNLPWDKALHFIGYAGLAFLARMGSVKHPSWQIIIGCIVFSLGIEFIQQFIPNRGFEWEDLIANSLGVLSGVLIAVLLKPLLIKDTK
ncbi:VanZ family protein [Kangiella shandongensis]|uniref:VanZ family protein n=1 Tax=Kangiella shandongensis TaxID=2763258 RepID=UPI001CC07CB4|nr:VanZ family protein [Kangiella shandongensis]